MYQAIKDGLLNNELNAYQRAVDAAAIVSITDIKGRIIYANDLFCEISKFKREELIGKSHNIINSGFHPKEFFDELWHTIKQGKIWHNDIKNKAKDGSFYWVDTTISPILNNNGEVNQYLSIRSLITERKNLESEREKLLADLTRNYNELMQYSFIVSHNLRSPIANVLGLSNLLRMECQNCDSGIITLIDYVSESAAAIDEIIKDLSKILTTRNPVHQKTENVNLLQIIKSVEDNLRKQISESGTLFHIHIDKDAVHFKSIKSYIQSIVFTW